MSISWSIDIIPVGCNEWEERFTLFATRSDAETYLEDVFRPTRVPYRLVRVTREVDCEVWPVPSTARAAKEGAEP